MKIVYIDMDGPMAHFRGGVGANYVRGSNPPEMFEKGFFRNLKPTEGSQEAIKILLKNPYLDLYVASKPTTENLWSTIEKYEWIEQYHPPLLKKIFLTCDKGHLNGHYLIDDDEAAWKDKFNGDFIWFHEQFPESSWNHIVALLGNLTE